LRYRTYIARSQSEAIIKIKNDLGPDATIVSVKKVKKRSFPHWIIPKEFIEIVAAVEDSSPLKQKPAKKAEAAPITYKREDASRLVYERRVSKDLYEIKKIIEKNFSDIDFADLLKRIRNDLSALKDSIKIHKDKSIPFELREHIKKADKAGIDPNLSRKFATDISENLPHDELSDYQKINALFTKMIAQSINVENIDFNKDKKVVCLIGPTGVGKTTTIAKLAATAMIKHKKDVAIITLDTYRIAAVEQLASYAKIMSMPMEIAFDKADVENAIKKFDNYQFIFIDTAGRSQKDTDHIKEIADSLPDEELDVLLTLAANVKDEDIEESYKSFGILPIKGMIFTKIDEANNLGSIFNISFKSRLPIYFFATGQRVPEDILVLEPLEIANMILRNE